MNFRHCHFVLQPASAAGLFILGAAIVLLIAMALNDLESLNTAASGTAGRLPAATLLVSEQPAYSVASPVDYGELFGPVAPAEPTAPAVDTPLSTIDLTLKGTFTGNGDTDASALIDNNGQTSRFHIGSEVAPGTTLVKVYPGRVILLRNGMKEQLVMNILRGEVMPDVVPNS